MTDVNSLLNLHRDRVEPILEIRVEGKPAPQGSKTPVGGGRMIENSKDLKPWRAAIKKVVEEYTKEHDWQGPIEEEVLVEVVFFFEHSGASRKRGDVFFKRAPDLDKLQRAVGDALSPTPVPSRAVKGLVGSSRTEKLAELKEKAKRWVALKDDALIVAWRSNKVYVDAFEGAMSTQGALIRIYPISSLGFDEGFADAH